MDTTIHVRSSEIELVEKKSSKIASGHVLSLDPLGFFRDPKIASQLCATIEESCESGLFVMEGPHVQEEPGRFGRCRKGSFNL